MGAPKRPLAKGQLEGAFLGKTDSANISTNTWPTFHSQPKNLTIVHQGSNLPSSSHHYPVQRSQPTPQTQQQNTSTGNLHQYRIE
ncbi:hypothetical protein EUGRSUZ_L00017 [Eucalyptus grandis]|uniref:Uncharacterized protein n=2 Tax=Eucalyptus grandis TaxID=71139 RepID=A0ACC3M0R4_EUCGR|nr:hypothetical protein EUGRSUZ_L00017 [Eucalyptus grandis]